MKRKKCKANMQLSLIDQATEKAIRQVEQEVKGKKRNYIIEWFRYIELTSKQLQKYLN